MTKQKINEQIDAKLEFIPLTEAENGSPSARRKVRAVGQTVGVVNANGHLYMGAAVDAAIAEAQANIKNGIPLTGQNDHPEWCEEASINHISVNWTEIKRVGQIVELVGVLSGDKYGQKIADLIDMQVPIGISLRGYGEMTPKEELGQVIFVITELHYEGFDFVLKPADANGAVKTLEAKKTMTTQESPVITTGAPLTLADLKKEQPNLVAQILAESKQAQEVEQAKLQAAQDALNAELAKKEAAIRQAAGVDNDADLIQVLESQAKQVAEAKTIQLKAEIEAVLDEGVKGTRFPDGVNKSLKESVMALNPKSAQEAKEMLARQLPIFNGLMAQQYMSDKGATVKAPIVESNGSIPELLYPTMRLVESMQRRGIGKAWDMNKPQNLSEAFAAKYALHAADFHKQDLIQEANSGTLANLGIPYSVMLGIIMQAIPELVSPNIFTFGTMTGPTMRQYYDAFVGETGKSVTVTAEAVTGASDTWVEMNGARINFGSVVLKVSSVTKTEGDDYLIDYEEGRVKTLSTGSISNGATLAIDYTYEAIRKGEGATIERGGVSLSYITMDAKADRLATLMTSEAINFAQGSLNDNLVARSVEKLVLDIRRRIDANLMSVGLTAALGVANNNAGTYTFGVDSLDVFSVRVGTAMSLIANRFYTPEWLLVSVTNGNKLANWKDFAALNARPGDALRPDGMIGTLKGLPVYQSTLFTDAYALVGTKELVFHNVFKPMTLEGPYQVNDVSTGKLIASKEYYVEEYNASAAPIPQKGSYIKLA